MICTKGLGIRRRGSSVLHDVDMTMKEGELLRLVGANGSGKTSLALALAGLIPSLVPARRSGELSIRGQDPATLAAGERVRLCGMAFQDPDTALCALTPYRELAFSLENCAVAVDDIRRRVLQVVDELKLGPLLHRPLADLSGGEKQLVAVAAAAIVAPALLIFDEASSYLDGENRARLFRYVQELRDRKPDMAILFIEHFGEGLPAVDGFLRCSAGRITREQESPAPWGSRFPKLPRGTSGESILSLAGLSFSWGDGVDIFEDLSLDLRRGEILVIDGPNGVGKSTLLKLIVGALKASRGRIDGAAAAYVPQNPEHMFVRYRVIDEILDATGELDEARELAARYGLAGLEEARPHELSGGEKRRLNIAVTSASAAPIVLLDEPTYGLDESGVLSVIETVDTLLRVGRGVLVVTHDEVFARAVADRRLRVEDRRLVEHLS